MDRLPLKECVRALRRPITVHCNTRIRPALPCPAVFIGPCTTPNLSRDRLTTLHQRINVGTMDLTGRALSTVGLSTTDLLKNDCPGAAAIATNDEN